VRFLSILAAMAGMVLLAACNAPVTKTPLFNAADEAGAPRLRPGVWQLGQEEGCQLDPSKPFNEWPECAGAGVVSPGQIVGHDAKKPKDELETTPFIFAAGDPRIIQVKFKTEGAVSMDAGDQHSSTPTNEIWLYGYAAGRPTKTDAQGQVTAVTYWLVLCGPPPPRNRNGADTAFGTLHPFAGMKMKPGDAACEPQSPAALRAAARASERYREHPMEAHWLRDGNR